MSDEPGPTDEATAQQVTLAWGDRLRGNEAPGQTIKGEPTLPEPGGVPPQMRTASIVLGAELEAVGPPSTVPTPASRPADYELKRLLGEGGMGVVYAARQRSLDREVALKLPRASGTSDERRFVQEAHVTGHLDHPNIVPVHELGRGEDGQLYLAMKLVRGTPWSALLRARPARALRDELEILLKVADAVAFAHARGILHRDLKPANVMVGDFGEVLVMDWGVAFEMAGGTAGPAARLCVGTPAYMPPEQALGEAEKLGPWSDVYLLGAILYEILTGTPPHRGTDVMATLVAAAKGEIEPPEARAAARAAPRELNRVALKSLSRRPEDRFPDVAAFQEALRSVLAHQESLRLGEEGLAQLARLERKGEVALAERYAVYTDALARLGQALHLWNDNGDARAGQARAALALANEALDRGDTGLAAAQLPLLAGNPAADPPGLAALEAALAVRRASRLRSALAAALMLGALIAAAGAIHAFRESARREQEAASARAGPPIEAMREAWKAARIGEPLAVARKRGALGDPWLRQAEEMLLWRAGRWSDVARAPFGAEAEPVTSRQAPPRQALQPPLPSPAPFTEDQDGEPSPECQRLRSLLSTPWTRQVYHPACKDGTLSEPAFWPALYDAARTGLPPETLARILEARGEPGSEAGTPRAWIALARGATAYFGREEALRRGDARSAARFERFIPPYRLAAPPFGPPEVPRREPPRLVEQPDHSWQARDAASGEMLWRSLPMAWPNETTGVALPVDDGSVVVSAANQLVRLSGANGAVLGRVRLEGNVVFLWPDPADRKRLRVLVATDAEDHMRGATLQGGVVEGPYQDGGYVTPGAAAILGAALAEEGAALLGIPKDKADQDPALGPRIVEGLRHAATLDPDNPDLWVGILEHLPATAPSEERRGVAARVASATGLPPREAIALGARLEAKGFLDEADTLYRKGAGAFLEQGGNTDLTNWSIPVGQLRQRVKASAKAGEVSRVIANVEMGRRFASYVEGDNRFYPRYAQWLLLQGREREAKALAPRLAESREYGGAFGILPGRFLLALDGALFVVALAPWALMALVGRGFLRSWATRNADLHARGWRTRAERLLAFFTHPVDRLRHLFLSYSSRGERLLMAALGAAVLAAACVLVGATSTIGNVATIAANALQGYAGSDAALLELEAQLANEPSAATYRLLAEGYRARHRTDQAQETTRKALALAPTEAQALNNTAVLADEAGRRDEALRGYERAARDHDEGALVARYNLARLGRDPARLESARHALAHRDRLRAEHFGPGVPLWALCPSSDLVQGLGRSRSLVGQSLAALREVALRPPGRVLRASTAGSPRIFTFATALLDAFGMLAWISVLAFVWIPFPVRPVSPAAQPRPARPWLRRVGFGSVALLGLLLPGTWDLLLGHAVTGALLQLVSVGAFTIARTIRSGGFFAQFLMTPEVFPEVPSGAFYPELEAAGHAATAVLVAIFVLNLVATLRRVRRTGVFGRPAAGVEA